MDIGRRQFLRMSAAAMAVSLYGPQVAAGERNGMPYRELGKTGEQVSLLCVGGSHIGGGNLSDEEAVALMRTAVDEGVNFFDNAWAYHGGRSEERMGQALKDGYRDQVFLMTKSTKRTEEGAQQDLEDSLRRMDVDVIDLWQLHELVDADHPRACYEDGPLDVAIKAQEEGKIRYIGFTGHYQPSTHVEMIERGFEWDSVQMPLSVMDHHYRSFEQTVLPMALERDIGVIAMKTVGGNPNSILATEDVSAAECLRYAMNLPVATVCSGMDSMEVLRENLATAKAFEPMSEEEAEELLSRSRPHSEDGAMEAYKTAWHE